MFLLWQEKKKQDFHCWWPFEHTYFFLLWLYSPSDTEERTPIAFVEALLEYKIHQISNNLVMYWICVTLPYILKHNKNTFIQRHWETSIAFYFITKFDNDISFYQSPCWCKLCIDHSVCKKKKSVFFLFPQTINLPVLVIRQLHHNH